MLHINLNRLFEVNKFIAQLNFIKFSFIILCDDFLQCVIMLVFCKFLVTEQVSGTVFTHLYISKKRTPPE